MSAEPHHLRTNLTNGTLSYTKKGLVVLFLWMLGGDFCFVLLSLLLPSLLPLQMKALGASNLEIGILIGSVPSIIVILVNPYISYKSDRHRGRWGRRIPFLIAPTPFIVFFLLLVAYAGEIFKSLRNIFSMDVTSGSPFSSLLVLGAFVTCFYVANAFVAGIYYYLFNDVVPHAFLGRFMALFRIVGTLALFVFNYFILGWAEHHLKEVYLGIAVLYGVVFTAMCLNVKEGKYEAPPKQVETGALSGIRSYLRECFSHPFYLLFYAATAVLTLPTAVTPFWILFAKQIGMSIGDYGKVIGWTSLASAVLLYPFGVLVDRLHPLKAMLIAGTLMIPFGLTFFYFVHGADAYFIASLAFVPLSTLALAANLPLYMSVLPAERYGQFCSAQGLVVSVLLILGNVVAGKVMDLVHNDYRYLYLWIFVFHFIGLILLIAFYFQWKKRGGETSYRPPEVVFRRDRTNPSLEVMQSTEMNPIAPLNHEFVS